jgi:uncharacterized protein (DUF1330 family)
LAAFLIVDLTDVGNEPIYAGCPEEVPSTLAAHGGRYLVRGDQVETLEGNWRPSRVVVVRFDSVEAARNWWSDPAYSELKTMRQRSTTTNMILVEGLPHA